MCKGRRFLLCVNHKVRPPLSLFLISVLFFF
nr:MAG TPA: hypothetical protein [Caudoviricetes sp.]